MVDNIVGLTPLLPVLGAFVTPLVYILSKSRRIVFATAILVTGIVFSFTLLTTLEAYSRGRVIVYNAGGWPGPVGIVYIVDRISSLLGLVTAGLVLAIAVYSYYYIVDDGYPWYLVLLLGAESGLLGVVYTGDYFNLFVMIEVTAVSSYGLVMYYRWRSESIVSGLKYSFIGALGTSGYLLALAIMYATYGSLNLVDVGLKAAGLLGSSITGPPTGEIALSTGLILALSLWAFSIKSGVFPNHFWLPDAHPAAPTPISALLSGLVVNAGAISLYKLLYLGFSVSSSPGVRVVVCAISLFTVVTGIVSGFIGSLLMMIQDDVKRLIAYSTVMNMGFIFAALGTLSPAGVLAFLYYTIIHSVAKATMFLSSGLLIKSLKSRKLEVLAGSGSRVAAAGLGIAVSSLTLAGIPPLPGFIGKLLIFRALYEYNIALAVAFIVSSAIAIVSYLRFFYIILVAPPTRGISMVSSRGMRLVVLALSIILLAMGAVFTFSPTSFNIVFADPVVEVGDVKRFLEELSRYLVGMG
ncbi:proton-conducting transporter transmembrane domain-containing protein [Thermogladius sp. 4427co]|uniref:proton-conducting transporter transmembrane domain-containing protein n=1 Tax=Thermogladius sp. 4427co TaxID=3450718 RepID=UPI003F78ED6A